MFHKLYTITQSSSAHRTESVSVMGHKLFAAMSSTVLDWRQRNFFDDILLYWTEIGLPQGRHVLQNYEHISVY